MNKVLFLSLLSLVCQSASAQLVTESFGIGANQFSMEFVTIGNPGNAADTTGFGSVAYAYKLGKYEISRDQMNKASTAGGLGFTLYDVVNQSGNLPATGISWNEAGRFVNYLNTSQGYQSAYNFTTSGPNDNLTLWTSGQSGYNPSNPYRNSNAYYFLPSVDEWYKAAYYDPNKTGLGESGGYWKYPTGSDSAPIEVIGGTSGAVYKSIFGGYKYQAEVDNAGGLSPYGTMAQGGNMREWNENAFDLSNDSASEWREWRGGSSNDPIEALDSQNRYYYNPVVGFLDYGFRVASVPEPSALSLLAIGLGGMAVMRRRRS
jgi:hypothetical protein